MKSALQALSGGITGVTSAALASGGGVKNAANANALYWGASPSFSRSSSSSPRTRAPFGFPPPLCSVSLLLSLLLVAPRGWCGVVSFDRARGRRAARRDHTGGVNTRGREDSFRGNGVQCRRRATAVRRRLPPRALGGRQADAARPSLARHAGRWSERAVAAVWSVVLSFVLCRLSSEREEWQLCGLRPEGSAASF